MSSARAVLLTALAALCMFPSFAKTADLRPAPQCTMSLAIEHIAIIDVMSGSVRGDQNVIVQDQVIKAIGSSDSLQPPNGATRVDGRGQFLIPGLWEMHVHTQDPDLYSRLYIANGITGIRDMGGDDPQTGAALSDDFTKIRRWRERIANGDILGPRVVAARSIIDGPPGFWPGLKIVTTAEEARDLVREDKRAGADFIKVYSLLRSAAFQAVTDEARRQGLEVYGHLSELVEVEDAIRAGQRTIEHFSEGRYLVVTSSVGSDIEERYRASFTSGADLDESWRNRLTILREAVNSHEPAKGEQLVRLLAHSECWQVPTWRMLRRELLDPAVGAPSAAPESYVPPDVRRMWASHPLKCGLADDAELVALAKPAYLKLRELVGAMRTANVRFLAGSDSGNPVLVPGFALHEELADLLEDAGFSPLEALQMATIRPAEFMGRLAESGTVSEGKHADLVLLRKNPLDDIRNSRAIEAVIVDGTYVGRVELDVLLAEVRRAVGQ
jgi:imidazolonepropionase-like amidohydrolase